MIVSKRTIKAGATATGRPELTKTDDEGIFDEPTLRQIRDPVPELPTDDLESGATLAGRKPEPVISEAADSPRKSISVGIWLALVAIGLLGCLAYLVFAPGGPVVRMPATAPGDLKVDTAARASRRPRQMRMSARKQRTHSKRKRKRINSPRL